MENDAILRAKKKKKLLLWENEEIEKKTKKQSGKRTREKVLRRLCSRRIGIINI